MSNSSSVLRGTSNKTLVLSSLLNHEINDCHSENTGLISSIYHAYAGYNPCVEEYEQGGVYLCVRPNKKGLVKGAQNYDSQTALSVGLNQFDNNGFRVFVQATSPDFNHLINFYKTLKKHEHKILELFCSGVNEFGAHALLKQLKHDSGL